MTFWKASNLNYFLGLVVAILLFLTIYFAVTPRHQGTSNSVVPSNVNNLYTQWSPSLIPPKLETGVVVYVSAPLFNMAENIYSLGVNGINPTNVESLIETLCGLQKDQFNSLADFGKYVLGVDPGGVAAEIAHRGWKAYIPARDGFVLAKFVNAVLATVTDPVESGALLTALTKSIYSNDCYALGAVCNVCLYNGNGLQEDDGSACENGMVSMRGLPMTIYRSQATDQFGPGASNPMQLGNASTSITDRFYTVKSALDNLDNKIQKIIKNKDKWWSGYNYCSTVPPAPLLQYWLEVGEAVYLYKYKSKQIIVDAEGLLDVKASINDEFYKLYYEQGSPAALVEITRNIKKRLDAVDSKWEGLVDTFK